MDRGALWCAHHKSSASVTLANPAKQELAPLATAIHLASLLFVVAFSSADYVGPVVPLPTACSRREFDAE